MFKRMNGWIRKKAVALYVKEDGLHAIEVAAILALAVALAAALYGIFHERINAFVGAVMDRITTLVTGN